MAEKSIPKNARRISKDQGEVRKNKARPGAGGAETGKPYSTVNVKQLRDITSMMRDQTPTKKVEKDSF